MWSYTTVLHPIKKQFKLTELDYCVIDMVARLATIDGFCKKSNIWIAENLGTSPKNVIAVLKKAVKIGLLEIFENGKSTPTSKRGTKLWHEAINLCQNNVLPMVTPAINNNEKVLPLVIQGITDGNTKVLPMVTPAITNGNTHNNLYNNSSNNNKESISDFEEKSQTPTTKNISKVVDEPIDQPEISETEKEILDAANKASSIIEINEILKYPTPEGVNEGVFYALRIFGVARQKGIKSKRMNHAAWNGIVKACQKASKSYQPNQLKELIDYATERKHISPFFAGYQDLIGKLQHEGKFANNPSDNELPFDNEQQEAKFQKTLKWIKSKFENISNTKIRQVNRAEFLELFELETSKLTKNYVSINGKESMYKIYCDCLQKLSADKFVNTYTGTLYAYLLSAFKEAKAKKI